MDIMMTQPWTLLLLWYQSCLYSFGLVIYINYTKLCYREMKSGPGMDMVSHNDQSEMDYPHVLKYLISPCHWTSVWAVFLHISHLRHQPWLWMMTTTLDMETWTVILMLPVLPVWTWTRAAVLILTRVSWRHVRWPASVSMFSTLTWYSVYLDTILFRYYADITLKMRQYYCNLIFYESGQ